jgi:hypothetical protein
MRITLAVFNGTSFDLIERAKNDLAESLRALVQTQDTGDPTHRCSPRTIDETNPKAGGRETIAEPPAWKKVVELRSETVEFASEAVACVWRAIQGKEVGEKSWSNGFTR